MNLQQIAADVPDYQVFLTVDELNASSHRLVEEFPSLANLKTVGYTRQGDPIELLTIEGGPLQAFVFGGPHPNEPIGTMTIEHLSRRLCEDEALPRRPTAPPPRRSCSATCWGRASTVCSFWGCSRA